MLLFVQLHNEENKNTYILHAQDFESTRQTMIKTLEEKWIVTTCLIHYTCLMQLFFSCMGQKKVAVNKNNCVRQVVTYIYIYIYI